MAAGTKDDPWALKTPPGTSSYTMYQDDQVLVCQVGSTTLKYQFRAIDDLHEWLAKQGGWVPLGEHADAIAVHDHRIAIDVHFPRKLAVGGVVTGEVRVRVRIAEVIDGHDLDLRGALGFVERSQDVAADAAVTIDTDLDWHVYLSSALSLRLASRHYRP